MIHRFIAAITVLMMIPASVPISAPPVPGENSSVENASSDSLETVQNSTAENSTSEGTEESDEGFIQALLEIFESII